MEKQDEDKRYQQPLDDEPDEGGLNDFDELHLAHQARGPYITGEELHEPLALNFFTAERLEQWRKEFSSHFQGEEHNMLKRIEKSIKSYARSVVDLNKHLLNLKLSLLAADETLKEAIREPQQKLLALEIHGDKLQEKLMEPPVFPADFLAKYQIKTQEIVDKALTDWADHIAHMDDLREELGDISIFRGISNSNYYLKKAGKPDFLSMYADIEGAVIEFFEPELLNSNSLSFDTAEKFLTMYKNQRRVSLEGRYNQFRPRLLSSFITSPSFKPNQFELLTIASSEPKDLRVVKMDSEFSLFRVE
ncbi:hypothetical protein Q4E93_34370 [Flavitalea sp. BT771]|uniref:hypothetical protein n=1 Tax=Flavitalea sp. BT771 TaxID=3063329 RepID=UPI0026E3FCCA|nr:hypothetical protein [Flavitalea sp. BT771]MDO6435751.1 hypothetical protein [Flavitalea sp. BT771]MDV6224652.1 hypothetical protein [Flavitalea sp. BT771]